MDYAFTMSAPPYPPKRPGSPLGDQSMPAAKVPRVNSSQLQINYLVRQKQDTLPLVTADERMSRILQLIGEYDGVLQRHESMAGNLGACPLGPILLKRFERLFDGPPRVLKSHAKDPSVTWLDVVEFAQNRPEQFNLEKQRNGVRVCQFYHKQCRVEISEEDYVLIASGMPQKLIPPQPILEDEEKELGVMDILERNLAKVVQMADQVSARARQLNHKLKTRKAAIVARRDAEADPHRHAFAGTEPPLSPMDAGLPRPRRSIEALSQSPPLGFTAVNVRQSLAREGEDRVPDSPDAGPSSQPDLIAINGRRSVSRADNLSKFLTESERKAGMTEDSVRRSSLPQLNRDVVRQTAQTRARQDTMSVGVGYSSNSDKGSPSVAIPNTPASLLPQVKPSSTTKDDGGPHKAEMVSRMENMQRGERIIPPCDRCRRLQMDCMKNLTACQGCTKKHAKCSWKEVTVDELRGNLEAEGTGSHAPAGPSEGGDTMMTEAAVRDWDSSNKDRERTEQRPPEFSEADLRARDPPAARVHSPVAKGRGQNTAFLPAPGHVQDSPKLDVRPPPLEQQIRDTANGKYPPPQGHYPNVYAGHGGHEQTHSKPRSTRDIGDQDEGDRLQELARQVYRSASQSVRPPQS